MSFSVPSFSKAKAKQLAMGPFLIVTQLGKRFVFYGDDHVMFNAPRARGFIGLRYITNALILTYLDPAEHAQ